MVIYPGDWEVKKLGDIATYRRERAGVPKRLYVSTENMRQNFGGIEPYRDKDLTVGISFSRGNVLIANIRPYLKKVYFADFDGSCSPDVLALEANEDVCAKFLYYCIANEKFISYVMNGGVKGTKMPRGDKKYIMQYPIPLPTLKEQTAIAETLAAFDTHITNLTELITKKKAIRDGALDELMTGRTRLGGFCGDWEVKTLGEIALLITKGTTPLDKSGHGSINFVKVENIDDDSGKISDMQKFSVQEHEGYLKRSRLRENDILFSIAGTLGRIALVDKKILPANTNQALAIIRLKNGNHEYVKYFLRSSYIKKFIAENPTTGAQTNLSLAQVSSIKISLPPLNEQIAIADTLSALDKEISSLETERAKISNIRDGAINDLLTGKVRLKIGI